MCLGSPTASFPHARRIINNRNQRTPTQRNVAHIQVACSHAQPRPRARAPQGTLTQPDAHLLDNSPFLFAAFMSAALRLVSLLLYQTAIQIAPLSVTIPYLSFTPAMLVVTAYLMIGEQPSLPGLVGVLVVTFGGYLLATSSTKAAAKKHDDDEPGSPPGSSGLPVVEDPHAQRHAHAQPQKAARQGSSPLAPHAHAHAHAHNESYPGFEMGSTLQLLGGEARPGCYSAVVRILDSHVCFRFTTHAARLGDKAVRLVHRDQLYCVF